MYKVALISGFTLLGLEVPWVGVQMVSAINHDVCNVSVLHMFICAISAGLISSGFLFKK